KLRRERRNLDAEFAALALLLTAADAVLFARALAAFAQLSERDFQLLLAPVAHDRQRRVGAGLRRGDEIAKIVRVVDGVAVEGRDNVVRLEPRALRRAPLLHGADDDAPRLFQSQPLRDVFGHG